MALIHELLRPVSHRRANSSSLCSQLSCPSQAPLAVPSSPAVDLRKKRIFLSLPLLLCCLNSPPPNPKDARPRFPPLALFPHHRGLHVLCGLPLRFGFPGGVFFFFIIFVFWTLQLAAWFLPLGRFSCCQEKGCGLGTIWKARLGLP